jgi:hypothetical protein
MKQLPSNHVVWTISSGNGLNKYLNPRVHGLIPTEEKNSTRVEGGEDRVVAVSGPPKVVGLRLLQHTGR